MVALWPPPRLAIQATARGSRMLVGIRVTGSTVTWSVRVREGLVLVHLEGNQACQVLLLVTHHHHIAQNLKKKS